jgi:hypothetical protein
MPKLKTIIATGLLAAVSTQAAAHEIWLERHGDTVRAYVGDATGARDQGETLAKLVPTSKLFADDPARAVGVSATADHLAAQATGVLGGKGDLRFYNDQVWAPWKNKEGVLEAAAFQARAGRTETRAVHDFELVPVAEGSDSFTLLFKGRPMPATDVTLINPAFWEKTVKTDAAGRVTVPVSGKGRYILVARHSAPADLEIAGQKVGKLQHIASTSFEAK